MNNLLRPVPDKLLETLSRRDLLTLIKGEQQLRLQMQAYTEKLETLNEELRDEIFQAEGKFVTLKNRLFGRSSEKTPSPSPAASPSNKKPKKLRNLSSKLPSDRYPNVDIIEKDLSLEELPQCRQCGSEMSDSGMCEVSEYLTVIPKQYLIIRQKRRKYRCGCCHADIQVTPGLPRIKPGSVYSDEMIIDVALSKYCDLIPIERYCAMSGRQGVEGLPPQSLIKATHYLAKFVTPAVEKLKQEVLNLSVMSGDETPHKMLEGDPQRNWFLWGFSGPEVCYFECHNTRSGDVAHSILVDAKCEIFLSDVYSGYHKAIGQANKLRSEQGLPPIKTAHCNAHSRRKFKEAETNFPEEAGFFIEKYREIYKLEKDSKQDLPENKLSFREKMIPLFESMKFYAQQKIDTVSSKSSIYVAFNYFLKNFLGLTLFLSDHRVDIDNNAQERLLRSPVVGRKTWYGTHSRKGAETASKLFSLVESCKLNQVNPRQYFKELVKHLHQGGPPFTPREFKNLK